MGLCPMFSGEALPHPASPGSPSRLCASPLARTRLDLPPATSMSRPSERRPISISNPTSTAPSRSNGTTSPTKAATARPRAPTNGGPRQQTNVGAKLLNKRQSVSYHAAIAGGIGLPMHVVPGVPSLPTVIPLPVQQLEVRRGGGSLDAGGSQAGRAVSPAGPSGAEQLASTGFDVDMLASEGFKPEECKLLPSP